MPIMIIEKCVSDEPGKCASDEEIDAYLLSKATTLHTGLNYVDFKNITDPIKQYNVHKDIGFTTSKNLFMMIDLTVDLLSH
jgi:uncharacterized membrane-anchored protein